MPHINLFYPFAPKENYGTLLNYFMEECKEINPFIINLKTFKYFHHRFQTHTIWLDPEPNELIINLQRELLKVIPEYNDLNRFGGFQPHLSVGQFTTYKILDFLTQLQKGWEELRFIVDRLYFISRENTKDSIFQIEKTIKLR
jgi:2'-5' RNA ligase